MSADLNQDRLERAEFLRKLHGELGSLLWWAELKFGENPAGTYPTEVEMTLRIAWLAVRRACEDAEQAAVCVPSDEEQAA